MVDIFKDLPDQVHIKASKYIETAGQKNFCTKTKINILEGQEKVQMVVGMSKVIVDIYFIYIIYS